MWAGTWVGKSQGAFLKLMACGVRDNRTGRVFHGSAIKVRCVCCRKKQDIPGPRLPLAVMDGQKWVLETGFLITQGNIPNDSFSAVRG